MSKPSKYPPRSLHYHCVCFCIKCNEDGVVGIIYKTQREAIEKRTLETHYVYECKQEKLHDKWCAGSFTRLNHEYNRRLE